MLKNILIVAILSVIIGGAAIPIGFMMTDKISVVYIGNVLGSIFSALIIIFIGDRIKDREFRNKINKNRAGQKIIYIFEQGESNRKVLKVKLRVDKHGLRFFSFLCPIFPGVFISSLAVYILDLDRTIYKKWMFSGILLSSGLYVLGYWFVFIS